MTNRVFTLNLKETFPRLARPPIVEAVIHWQARAQSWPEPHALDAALKESFPEYSMHSSIQHVEMSAMVSDVDASTAVHRSPRGMRLKSDDGFHVMQFTRDGLVFSQVQGYERWEQFRDAAKAAWQSYLDIAAPIETQRLGVRYINHIATATPATLQSYLRDPPTCPSSLPLKEFVYQSTFEVAGHPFGIRVIKVMQPAMPELPQSSGLFLDIDVYSTNSIANDVGTLDEALETMRWLKNKVFFGLLTEDAIESFK